MSPCETGDCSAGMVVGCQLSVVRTCSRLASWFRCGRNRTAARDAAGPAGEDASAPPRAARRRWCHGLRSAVRLGGWSAASRAGALVRVTSRGAQARRVLTTDNRQRTTSPLMFPAEIRRPPEHHRPFDGTAAHRAALPFLAMMVEVLRGQFRLATVARDRLAQDAAHGLVDR